MLLYITVMLKKRELWGDILRIIGSIMVIAIHVVSRYRQQYANGINPTNYFVVSLIDSTTRVAVPIFFMLTGAFALKKFINKPITRNSYIKFLKHTFITIGLPFILFSFLIYVYSQIQSGNSWSLPNFIRQLTNFPGVQYHMWFMYILFLIYACLPFIGRIVSALRRNELFLLILVIFILGNVLFTVNIISSYYHKTMFYNSYLPDALIYCNYLFVGYYITNYTINKKFRNIIYFTGFISTILLPITIVKIGDFSTGDQLVLGKSIMPFFSSIAVFIFGKRNLSNITASPLLTNLLTKLTTISFFIYMIHVVVRDYVGNLLSQYIPANNFPSELVFMFLHIVITFITSAMVAYVFYSLYQQGIKICNWLLSKISIKSISSLFSINNKEKNEQSFVVDEQDV